MSELRTLYEKEQLVLFVGGGLSLACGMPGWRRIIDQLSREAAAQVPSNDRAALERSIREDDFFSALDILKRHLGERVTKIVQEEYSRDPLDVPLWRAVASLAPRLRAVVSTALDRSIDQALGGWPTIVARPRGPVPENRFLWKVHGSIENPSTWYIAGRDKANSVYADPSRLEKLVELFRSNSVLFIATNGAMYDPFFQFLTERIGAEHPPYYAIVHQAVTEPGRKFALGELGGVGIVPYQNHEELPTLLKALQSAHTSSAPVRSPEPLKAENSGPSSPRPPTLDELQDEFISMFRTANERIGPRPILFTGGGLGKSAGLPGFGSLAKDLGLSVYPPITLNAEPTDLIARVIRQDHRNGLQWISKKIPLPLLAPIHNAIISLPWEMIVIAGYDDIIERACEKNGVPAESSQAGVAEDVARLNAAGRLAIFRLFPSASRWAPTLQEEIKQNIVKLQTFLERQPETPMIYFGVDATGALFKPIVRRDAARNRRKQFFLTTKEWMPANLRSELQRDNFKVLEFGSAAELHAFLERVSASSGKLRTTSEPLHMDDLVFYVDAARDDFRVGQPPSNARFPCITLATYSRNKLTNEDCLLVHVHHSQTVVTSTGAIRLINFGDPPALPGRLPKFDSSGIVRENSPV